MIIQNHLGNQNKLASKAIKASQSAMGRDVIWMPIDFMVDACLSNSTAAQISNPRVNSIDRYLGVFHVFYVLNIEFVETLF